MKWVVLVCLVTTAAVGFAFRVSLAASPAFWWSITLPYALLAALALYRLWDDGTLFDRLTPRWGDLSLGTLIALLLLLGTWVGRSLLTPTGSAEHAWVSRVYFQIGDTELIQRSTFFTVLILAIAMSEELVWRGLVLTELNQLVGSRRASPLCAFLYALSLTPTLVTLADPIAGPNPLLVLAALGCGLFWSFSTNISGRLPPAMIAHAAFSYFTVVQFHLPGM